jgi:hypothetical protein
LTPNFDHLKNKDVNLLGDLWTVSIVYQNMSGHTDLEAGGEHELGQRARLARQYDVRARNVRKFRNEIVVNAFVVIGVAVALRSVLGPDESVVHRLRSESSSQVNP